MRKMEIGLMIREYRKYLRSSAKERAGGERTRRKR
jgi:hypothetical protein